MASFAELDENNIVLRVVSVYDKDTQDENGVEREEIGAAFLNNILGGRWLKTSFNTVSNSHLQGGTPFRKNYAGIGYSYNSDLDAFIPPKPDSCPSHVLNTEICQWVPPIPVPEGGTTPVISGFPSTPDNIPDNLYVWDEPTISWVKLKDVYKPSV